MKAQKGKQSNSSPTGRLGGAISEPQALNRIADYCSRAERCEFDVRKKLAAWELPEDAIKRILDRLKKERYLNDDRYAKSFINDKLKFNKWGKTKIIFELRKRKISESIYNPIFEELSADEFEEQLIHILSVKIKSVKGKNDYEKKTKLIRFAIGRGFSMGSTIKCVNKLMGGDYENDFS
ncbi:regulatory protein [Dysgonomonas hofstadii]|uniref:Regulatory protein RecX n=1 Tax=Dysgonomonas hofstadii TaxID=637886 RepID=A0A840CPH2_9BACT|nr:regulatory protein RecX [Dysgonomonas hofstadii]MBB4034472.1 regulatory protein [Dysgonomonas hofstadii]